MKDPIDIQLPPFKVDEEYHLSSRSGRLYSWGLDFLKVREVWGKSEGEGVINYVLDTENDPDTIYLKYDPYYSKRFTNEGDDIKSAAGHGVHVADTIQQVAPKAVIGLVKGLSNSGSGSSVWIAAAIRWIADMEPRPEHAGFYKVVNMSLGSPVPSGRIEDAMKYARSKGVLFCSAAGNGGNDVDFPGGYDPLTITVAAITREGGIATFSDRGPAIDLGAPGVGVIAEYKGRLAALSGTSMATPHVAGILSLILGFYREITDAESFIKGGATDAGEPGEDDLFGAGYPIAPKYFDGIVPDPDPDPTPDEPNPVPLWLWIAGGVVVGGVVIYFVFF